MVFFLISESNSARKSIKNSLGTNLFDPKLLCEFIFLLLCELLPIFVSVLRESRNNLARLKTAPSVMGHQFVWLMRPRQWWCLYRDDFGRHPGAKGESDRARIGFPLELQIHWNMRRREVSARAIIRFHQVLQSCQLSLGWEYKFHVPSGLSC